MGEMQEMNPSQNILVSSLSVILPIHQADNSMMPFVHALKLAYASQGELEIVDVRREEEALEYIGVRALLEKWGVLPNSSKRSDVFDAGVRIKKIVKSGNKKAEIIKRIRRHSHDLLVIGTKSVRGIGTIFGRDLAEYLADYFRHNTLFIPSGSRPFVDMNTGNVNLENIVVPVESAEFFNPAIEKIRRLLELFPEVDPRIIGLHVGNRFPDVDHSILNGLNWETELRKEPVHSSIINSCIDHSADLLVMGTNGRQSLTQILIGSNTEQVLRESQCPVLSIAV